MSSCIQLPKLRSIAGANLLPWKRFWSPFGGSIAMDGMWSSETTRGFFAEPSKYTNTNCRQLTDWIKGEQGCWILCGAPGTGKSGELNQLIKHLGVHEPETIVFAYSANSFASGIEFDGITSQPQWRLAESENHKIVLILDGFDQSRMGEGLPFETLATRLSFYFNIDKLRLLIGCRAADWDPARGQSLLDLWPKTEEHRVLEVCPLTRSDIELAASFSNIGKVSDFIGIILEKRLDAIAHWPLTLKSLLDEFNLTKQLPDAIGELISRTIDKMLLEPAKNVGTSNRLGIDKLRQLARRSAALSIFGGFRALGMDDHLPETLTSSALIGGETLSLERLSSGGVFEVTSSGMAELLRTALFTPICPPSEVDSSPPLGFTHHSYAEFLAAEYLKPLSVTQLQSLMLVSTSRGMMVPSQIVEIAAWLAVMHDGWFDCLNNLSPEILLRSDGARYTNKQKRSLMEKLLTRIRDLDASVFLEMSRLTPSFSYPDLAKLLAPLILARDEAPLVRRFAIQVASKCRVNTLEEQLWQVLERGDDIEPRIWISSPLYEFLKDTELTTLQVARLKALLHEELGPDDYDDLKGVALTILVPSILAPRHITQWLSIRKRDSYSGYYEIFLEHMLPTLITEEDIEAFLELACQQSSIQNRQFDCVGLRHALLEGFSKLTTPSAEIKSLFVKWVLSYATRYSTLVTKSSNEELTVSPLDQFSLNWLELIINESDEPKSDIYSILKALGIIDSPVLWALEKLAHAKASKRAQWARLCKYWVIPRLFTEEIMLRVIEAYERFHEFRETFKPCLEGMNICETLLSEVAEFEAANARNDQIRLEEVEKHVTPRQMFDDAFRDWSSSKADAWITLWWACGLAEDGSYFYQSGHSINEWKGWLSLSDSEKESARLCARGFLLSQKSINRSTEYTLQTNLCRAAAAGIDLLENELKSDEELRKVVQESWIVIWAKLATDATKSAKRTAAILFELQPKAMIQVIRERFELEKKGNRHCQSVALLDSCWSEQLSVILCEWLSENDIQSETLMTGFSYLASKSAVAVNSLADLWLEKIEQRKITEDDLIGVIQFCSMLMTFGKQFERVLEPLASSNSLRNVLNRGATCWQYGEKGFFDSLAALNTEQLEKLYLNMATLFLEKPEIRLMSARDMTTNDMMSNGTDFIESVYAKRATSRDILSVHSRLPKQRQLSLAFARAHQTRHDAASSLKPVKVEHLLKLIKYQHSCFIYSNDDLVIFLHGRITAFQELPWDVSIQPLWNEPRGKEPSPKHEDVLSNSLKRWLDEARHLVINREVQPIEIMPHRLDLKIDIPGEPKLSVIIEVKKAENDEAGTSMQQQLVDDYLIQGGQTHGIYLLARFKNGRSKVGGSSVDEDRLRLQDLHSKLILPDNLRVSFSVLDCTYKKRKKK